MTSPCQARLAIVVTPLFLAVGCARQGEAAPPARPQAVAAPAPTPGDGEDWNDAQIRWLPFAQGLQVAAAERKPVCLVFFTTWCPHCKAYRKVFDDAGVVELARRLVMIRLDKERHPELSRRFAPDGEYIPRTFFLASDGTLAPGLQAPRPQYRYFYDESDPESLRAGMEKALQTLR